MNWERKRDKLLDTVRHYIFMSCMSWPGRANNSNHYAWTENVAERAKVLAHVCFLRYPDLRPYRNDELLLAYMLKEDERELFDTFPRGSAYSERQISQWRLLRDISQLRMRVERLRRRLIDLNQEARRGK